MHHQLLPEPASIHGLFSRDLAPALVIDPGDTVTFHTLDCGWGAAEQAPDFAEPADFPGRDPERDNAHALAGPVAIRGALPAMTLEVAIKRIRPGAWGWSAGVAMPAQLDARMGLGDQPVGPPAVIKVPRGAAATYWKLDATRMEGVSRSGYRIKLRPFMGVMGMPLDRPGIQSTFPPTACGGNMDCRDLIEGSTLYLPIAVAGGLFSTGDGHAAQGDGEVAGPGLNCPMEVELEFRLHNDLKLEMPRARTPEGWTTFGFHTDLNEAATIATLQMVKLMGELYGLAPKAALTLAGLTVNLHVTQIVNGVRGVHAVLPHGALEKL